MNLNGCKTGTASVNFKKDFFNKCFYFYVSFCLILFFSIFGIYFFFLGLVLNFSSRNLYFLCFIVIVFFHFSCIIYLLQERLYILWSLLHLLLLFYDCLGFYREFVYMPVDVDLYYKFYLNELKDMKNDTRYIADLHFQGHCESGRTQQFFAGVTDFLDGFLGLRDSEKKAEEAR